METKIPARFLTPRLLSEIPRSQYVVAPTLSSNDEKSRKSFIALLRKGPDKASSQSRQASAIEINCAIWISLDKPVDSCVSLLLHCKEKKEDYCLILDETTIHNSEQLMLSGKVVIHPTSKIEFLRIACSGISQDYNIRVDDIHLESHVDTGIAELRRMG